MKIRSAALLMAASLSALFSNSAHAAKSTAFASVSNFKISLIDLAPQDSIAPSLQALAFNGEYAWRPGSSFVSPGDAQVWQWYAGKSGAFRIIDPKTDNWDPVRAEHVASNGTATLASGSAISGTSLQNLNLAARSSVSSSAVAGNDAYASAMVPLNFVLSPNTGLSISWDITLDIDHPSAKTPGTAMANAAVRFLGKNMDHSYSVAQTLGRGSLYPSVGKEGTTSFSHYLTAGEQELKFAIEAYAVADTRSGISPVPEPHTWGMLLAGLGLVGAAARRARSNPV